MKAKAVQEYLVDAINFFQNYNSFLSNNQHDIQDQPGAKESFSAMSKWMREVASVNANKSLAKLQRLQENHPPIIELRSFSEIFGAVNPFSSAGDSPKRYVTPVADEAAYNEELNAIAAKTRDLLLRAQEVLNIQQRIAANAANVSPNNKHTDLLTKLNLLKQTCERVLNKHATLSKQAQTKSWFAKVLHQGALFIQVHLVKLGIQARDDKKRIDSKQALKSLSRQSTDKLKPTKITKLTLGLGDTETPTSDEHYQHFPANFESLNAFRAYMLKTKFMNISPSGITAAMGQSSAAKMRAR